MPSIPTRKYSAATLFKGLRAFTRSGPLARFRRNERGQGFLEYILVLMVVLGTIFVLARPVISRLQGKIEKGLKGGIFKADPSGGNFYYFPLK
jgi:hypothetical protein